MPAGCGMSDESNLYWKKNQLLKKDREHKVSVNVAYKYRNIDTHPMWNNGHDERECDIYKFISGKNSDYSM